MLKSVAASIIGKLPHSLVPRSLNRPRNAYRPDDSVPHVVIVGAGFGGLTAAKALRNVPVRVTLIDQHNYHVFQPLLYQVATASLSPADIAYPIRSILRRNRNTEVVLARAQSVDIDRRRVQLDSHDDVEYDFLILATGVVPAYFGHTEWSNFAPGLKDIDDAVEIRNHVFEAFERAERRAFEGHGAIAPTIAIVGGGPTGVELSGSVAEIARHTLANDFRAIDPRTSRILLINGSKQLLKGFPDKLARSAERDLKRLGVEVRTGARVTNIEQDTIWLGDEEIQADAIIWAAGVSASPLATFLGVPLDDSGRVVVEPDMSIPGHPEVFVVGDLAAAVDEHGAPLPGLAPAAIQAAKLTVENIQRQLTNQPTKPLHYRDKGTMATIGRGRAVAVIGGRQFDGFLAWVLWAVVHVWSLIGFRSRLAVMIQWGWVYLTQQRTARLIIGELRRPGTSD